MNEVLGLAIMASGILYLLNKWYSKMTGKEPLKSDTQYVSYSPPVSPFPQIDNQQIMVPDSGKPIFGDIPVTQSLDDIYKKYAAMHGIDWRLLKAIAIQESSERTHVHGPAGEIGLMQVLCIPNASGQCTARFNVKDWPPKHYTDLYDADYNVHIAAQIFRWNLDYAKGDIREALAIYNGGLNHPQFGYAAEVMSRYNNLVAGGRGERDSTLV